MEVTAALPPVSILRARVVSTRDPNRCTYLVLREGTRRTRCSARQIAKLGIAVEDKNGRKFLVGLPLKVCRRHSRAIPQEEVLNDKAWKTVRAVVLKQGGRAPRRSTAEVVQLPL
jgi:hypothetical protein